MTLIQNAPVRDDAPLLGGPWVDPGAPAVVLDDRILSHRELDGLVRERAAALGTTRRLILLECANALEPLVTYLAALRGRHPVLLMPERGAGAAQQQWDRVAESYAPDVLCTRDGRSWVDTFAREGSAHDLHPDLAVLLGTSGSTGTPKLVRLSRENLRSNAEAIAGYLSLDGSSRAATTLPMQYCYGLSVVNSHLLAGGSLWLTDASVVDPDFFDDFARAGAASFAGVPYTFELLERLDLDWLGTPGLSQVTQAGGRLAPEKVRALALAAARNDVDLFVMYGQTEATARMAYLPPSMAATRPECIGVPIEGGELRIEGGELVYAGPNVMMGYADTPADLALGPVVTELRTGDLAVQHDDGLFEIVGRRNRIAKLFGVRLDLEHAERLLAQDGVEARLVVHADRLHVFLRDGRQRVPAVGRVRSEHCLPAHAVEAHVVDAYPTTPSGKTDLVALEAVAAAAVRTAEPRDVRAAYVGVFGPAVADDDSFLTLRGDSLSYVEIYTQLERHLGTVPVDWPALTVGELASAARRPRRRSAALETPLVLRACAIVLLVGAHVELWDVKGGAHVLLAVLGYNLGRFALAHPTPGARLRATGRAVLELLLPAVVLISGVILVRGQYEWTTAFMLNQPFGPDRWTDDWQFWFLEAAAWSALGLAGVLALPGVRGAFRRNKYLVVLVVLAGAMALRAYAVTEDGVLALYSPESAAWTVVLGVLAAVSATRATRLVTSVLAVVCVHGFFDTDLRGNLVAGAVVLLLWVPHVRLPRLAAHVVSTIASASLFIYITHWQVYPYLEDEHNRLALLASLACGVVTWGLWTAARARLPLPGRHDAPTTGRRPDLRTAPAPAR